jgi:hypothetical protein
MEPKVSFMCLHEPTSLRLCITLHSTPVFKGKRWLTTAPNPGWRATTSQLSVTAYWVYLQQPSHLGAISSIYNMRTLQAMVTNSYGCSYKLFFAFVNNFILQSLLWRPQIGWNFYHSTRRHTAKGSILHSHCDKNLKPNNFLVFIFPPSCWDLSSKAFAMNNLNRMILVV